MCAATFPAVRPSELLRASDMRFLLIWAVLFAGAAQAASVGERDGNIFYVGDDGVSRQLTAAHIDAQPLLSPDEKKVVFLRTKPKSNGNEVEVGAEIEELWLAEISGQPARRLLDTRIDDDPEKILSEINTPVFSADSKKLYFLTAAWAVSNALHVLDFSSGIEHFVTDANDVLVIDKGKYANHLVVMKHKYFKREGSYDYYWLITPEGKEIKMVGKDKEQAERFIRSQR